MNLETGRMATLHGSQGYAFDNRFLLRVSWGRVLAVNPRGVANLHVAAPSQFPAVVRTEAVRPLHVVDVGDERPHVRDGL